MLASTNLRNFVVRVVCPRIGGLQRRQHTISASDRHRGRFLSASTNSIRQEQPEIESWELNLTGEDNERLIGPRKEWWWSGGKPEELVGSESDSLHFLPQITLDGISKDQVQRYVDNTWGMTELLFSGLQGEEAFFLPPYHHLRHPLIFYYGHVATFYANKLYLAGLIDKGIDRYFEDIFEVGVDEMSWDDMSKNAMKWPTVGEVNDYRHEAHRMVSKVVKETISADGSTKVDMKHPLWSLFMCTEHERIHIETSSVLMREMPLRLLERPKFWPGIHPSGQQKHNVARKPRVGVNYPKNEMIHVKAAIEVHIGKNDSFPTFGWDNEYGHRKVTGTSDFSASKFMVSNGEFYEFVVDGGYQERRFWTEDGWGWRTFRNARQPSFWEPCGRSGSHEFQLRTIFEVVDMPWPWPVDVNKHEATAFCNWKAEKDGGKEFRYGLRLVTEAEHILMRDSEQRPPLEDLHSDPVLNYGGDKIAKKAGVNLNLAFGSESPVDALPANGQGFHDVTGNVWEWSEDDFNPLPGFAIHKFYDDFSTPCFDGEHNMILGGSFMSGGDAGANLHCRYHFRPHFLQHSGFRYVAPSRKEAWPGQGVATKLSHSGSAQTGGNVYETQSSIDQYLALHFGQTDDVVNQTIRPHKERPGRSAMNFPKRCADLLAELSREHSRVGPGTRALDLGCAVGGSSFELTKAFEEVVGIDFSHGFINAAKSIRDRTEEGIKFTVSLEGTRTKFVKAQLDENAAAGAHRVIFKQGDACNLDEKEGVFDAVLMANLLCRLPDPEKCLRDLHHRVTSGGVVLIVSPFSWLEEFTPEPRWLSDRASGSAELLTNLMEKNNFRQIHSQDMPLMIREHERKYQYIISHAAAFSKI